VRKARVDARGQAEQNPGMARLVQIIGAESPRAVHMAVLPHGILINSNKTYCGLNVHRMVLVGASASAWYCQRCKRALEREKRIAGGPSTLLGEPRAPVERDAARFE
jgi:hypothetical protein